MTAVFLERGTKPFILLSMFAAASLAVTTAAGWQALPWASVIALVSLVPGGKAISHRRYAGVDGADVCHAGIAEPRTG